MPSIHPSAVLDREQLRDITMDDEELMREILAVLVDDTLNKLGITDQILPKVKPGGPGAVVKGDVDFALAFQNEINDPGVEIVGPLPAAVSTPAPMVVVLSTHAKNPAIAKQLLEYLATPAAKAVYKSMGMVPAS